MSLPSPAEIAAALVARDEMPPEKGDIGPQGMEGKAGEFGPPGPQGPKGDPGRDGTNGSNGDIGPVGPQGPGGPRGLKGDKGDKGDEGERGIQGPQGETGAVGSGRALFPRAGGGGSGGAPSGAAGGDLSGTYPNPGVVNDSHSHGAGTVSGLLPLAAPSGTIDTTTYDDSVTGSGKYRTLILPTQDAILAVAIAGDAFPRIVMTGDPTEGTYLGDGTQNPVNDGASSWIEGPDANGFFSYVLEGGGANQARFSDLNANVGYRLALQTGIGLNAGGANLTISTVTGAPTIGGNVGDIAIRKDPSGTNDLIYRCTVAGIAGAATWVAQALGLSGSTQTYTESNVTTDRAFNANSTTLDELADVLGTLIADLRTRGVVA